MKKKLNKMNINKAIIFFFLTFILVNSAKKKNIVYKSNSKDIYELRMQRINQNNTINVGQIVTSIASCDSYHRNVFHNSTWSTLMCFERDLSYQISASTAKPKQKNQEFLNLEININSPWSWIAGFDCMECSQELDSYTYQSLSQVQCEEKCEISKVNKLSKFNPFKINQNQELSKNGGKKAAITTQDSGIYGIFLNYMISFIAYNPNRNITIKDTVKEKLSFGSYNALEDLTTVKKLKVLHAQKLSNIQQIAGQGSIGLGRLDIEFDSKNIEPETHFLKQLIESVDVEEQGDMVFGIYINRQNKEIQDFALTLGGYNAEYSSEVDIEKYFVDLRINKKKSNYQYILPLNSINVLGESFQFTEAYITLSSSFLIIPFEILTKIVSYMNSNYSMGCSIVDKKYLMVFCTDIVPRVFNDKEVNFQFDNLAISIPFKDFLHVCKHDKIALFNQDISQSVSNQCILNIASSPDNKVILGEVFLNKRYTIFDIQNNRIGFLPPQTVNFFSDENEKRAFVDLLMKIVTFIFIAGIVALYFMNTIWKILKSFLNYLGKLIDIQKLPATNKYSSTQNQQFQQISQTEGIEIQNNSLNYSFDNKFNVSDKNHPVVVPANVIPSFKLHPQKRKIFETKIQKPQNNPNNQQQKEQNNLIDDNSPKLENIDLL
ncbi:eukaryotic aspartyl protease (macronuclear) [Tetrahymena thermophila SB210]|uniref:Eukaryotic aspartyl protease n=1 Tax=Tetrahymena thermophila (strain SB210) TaxID=312017 RepID=I7LTX0_TETTS|nr:eukaryotic aspartyl protease [Tetrahymena thermophila SB210]EAR87445.3 eukaryotic aspartyl protease [Tetrahymena thermophila SB210]|eukprot:XP_001007690.3 eukaryotic aspartyl protease [Tetrahymena thermophila SB210]